MKTSTVYSADVSIGHDNISIVRCPESGVAINRDIVLSFEHRDLTFRMTPDQARKLAEAINDIANTDGRGPGER